MQYADFLLTIAEVGVALAGFASLISVFGQSGDVIDFTRLLGMVRTSLTAAGFALFPFVPSSLGVEEPTLWRVSAAALFVAAGTSTALAWRTLFRVRRRLGGPMKRVGYFTYPMSSLTVGLAFAGAVLPSGELTSGLYVSSVAGLISISGALFLSLFGDFIRRRLP